MAKNINQLAEATSLDVNDRFYVAKDNVDSYITKTNLASSVIGEITTEQISDLVFPNIAGGTKSGITITYDDAGNEIDFTVIADTANLVDDAVTTAKIADDAVTDAQIASGTITNDNIGLNEIQFGRLRQISEATFIGRSSGVGTGNVETMGPSVARTILNVEDGATADQTAEEIQDLVSPAITGGTNSGVSISYDDNSNAFDFTVTLSTGNISNSAVTTAKIADGAVTGIKIADDTITQAKLADDAVGADQLADEAVVTASVVDDAITLAKMQNVSTDRLLGRLTASTGNIEELTSGQVRTFLNIQAGVTAATVAVAKALTSELSDGETVRIITYASGHPVTLGVYLVSSGQVATEYQGLSFNDTAGNFYFELIHNGNIDCRIAGAIADGSTATDIGPACNAVLNFLEENGGGTAVLPAQDNYYTVDTDIIVPGGTAFVGTGNATSQYWQDSDNSGTARDPYTVRKNYGTVIWAASGFTGAVIDAGGSNDKGVSVENLTIDLRNAAAGSSLGDIVGIRDNGSWISKIARNQVVNLPNNNCVGIERDDDTSTGVCVYEQNFVGQNGSSGTAGSWNQTGTGFVIATGAHITLRSNWVRWTNDGYDYNVLAGNNFIFDCTAENVAGDAINADGSAELTVFGGEYTADTNCTVGNVLMYSPGSLSGTESAGTAKIIYDNQNLDIFLNGDEKSFDVNFNGGSAFRVQNKDASLSRPQFIVQSNFLGAASPSFSFSGDEDTGFYRIGADSVGVACGGSLVTTYTTTGINNTAIGATTKNTGAFTTLSASETTTLSGPTVFTQGSDLAVTSNEITPSATFQRITSAGNPTIDTITAGTPGQIVILTSDSGANTITLTETGGNLNLGAGTRVLNNVRDRIILMYYASGVNQWVEIVYADNA